MKPTLKEIEDNYERVLLQLENGHLAGIRKIYSFNCYNVVEQRDWFNHGTHAIELSKGYKRKSVYGYNIDRIKFLSDRNEVDNFLQYEECEIDWDWDINNPHSLKFKKGDEVRILDAENRENYKQILTKTGKIARITTYKLFEDDVERITYYVEIPEFRNEYQSEGLWVFHNEMSIALTSNEVTCDDQRDAYTYCMFGTRYHITEIDDIIKGDNNMINGILKIYGDRKRGKINKHYEQLMELTKLADERYAIFKDCSDKLDKLYKEDGVITNHLVEPKLAETTKKHLEKLAELREEEFCKLENLISEVHAQLSMCETYEQKQNVLNTYKILKANGKINA